MSAISSRSHCQAAAKLRSEYESGLNPKGHAEFFRRARGPSAAAHGDGCGWLREASVDDRRKWYCPKFLAADSGHQRGNALRSLAETTAMRIGTAERSRNQFDRRLDVRLAQSGTTCVFGRLMGGVRALVCIRIRGRVGCHLMVRTHVTGTHGEHGSHSHLGPCGNHDQQ